MTDKSNSAPLSVMHIASGDLWAGAEVQLFTLARELQNAPDIMVSVVLLNHGVLEDRLHEAGVDVRVLDETRLSGFRILRALVQLIRKQRPDVIHTHRLKENILGSIAGYLAGRVPSMRTTHGAPEHTASWRQLPKRIIRLLDRLTGKYIQRRIIAVSEDLAVYLRQAFPAEKVRTIENGIDLGLIYNRAAEPVASPGNGNNRFIIGLAGRLVPVKRIDLFIEAARHIQDNHPDIRAGFHIYGDGPLRRELEALSHELGTDGIVYFEGHCDDFTERLKHLDILMMTSDHEGLPMVLLEAMALKVPVIAHAVGGIPKLLDYGTCGVLVEEHNAEAYAHEIHHLLGSPATRSSIPELALERVRTHYSAEQNAHQYILQYNEIRNPHKP